MSVKSRKQQFIFLIEQKILSGEWKIGDKLPTERELVDKFGASRTVVNAALAELAQKGFLEINPRQWTRVADYKRDGRLEVLYSMIRHNGDEIDFELLHGILAARKLVETESVILACRHRTADDILRLEEIVKAEKAAVTMDDKIKLDFKFHHMLCVIGKNPVYPLIMNSFEPIAVKYLKIFYTMIDENVPINVEHNDILDAIKKRDEQRAIKALSILLDEGEEITRLYGGKKK